MQVTSVPNLVRRSGNDPFPQLAGDVVTAKRAHAGVWSDYPAALSAVRDLKPGLAVAVCTFQRPASLLTFLRSVEIQTRRPDQLLIIDASPGADSEAAVLQAEGASKWADEVIYIRVTGQLRGLTRQRNVALRLAERDTIAFFDDDVVIEGGCLMAMGQVLEARSEVVGVGAVVTNESTEPGWRWKLMRVSRAVSDLVPGRYQRSGFSIPLRLLKHSKDLVEVDRLCGCALWRTELARELGFATLFKGYSQSEDVEFSRRASVYGKLLICSGARMEHHHSPLARPNVSELMRMGIMNRYYIQRTTLVDYSWRDSLRFAYANFIYTVILAGDYLRRGEFADVVRHFVGSLMGACDAILWRRSQRRKGGLPLDRETGDLRPTKTVWPL